MSFRRKSAVRAPQSLRNMVFGRLPRHCFVVEPKRSRVFAAVRRFVALERKKNSWAERISPIDVTDTISYVAQVPRASILNRTRALGTVPLPVQFDLLPIQLAPPRKGRLFFLPRRMIGAHQEITLAGCDND